MNAGWLVGLVLGAGSGAAGGFVGVIFFEKVGGESCSAVTTGIGGTMSTTGGFLVKGLA